MSTNLNKKVLFCDFNSLIIKMDQQLDIEIDKGLFGESKIEQCAGVLRLVMLIEIEKHEGIVYLATNRRAHELMDEAKYRRITMVLEYSTPDNHLGQLAEWDDLQGQIQPLVTSSVN